jgi:3-dehydroquinate dehydratase-1
MPLTSALVNHSPVCGLALDVAGLLAKLSHVSMMSASHRKPEVPLGNVIVGNVPRVVGTVSTADGMKLIGGASAPACDIVELRLDKIGVTVPADGKPSVPVLLTIRLSAEGGDFSGNEAARRAEFLRAMPHGDAIDVEYRSVLLSELSRAARGAGKAVVVSYHDFLKTPPSDELRQIISSCVFHMPCVVKIATMTRTAGDVDRLRQLLGERWPVPLCVIAMGDAAAGTREEFARLGSCLTYGYLDQPVAPGQVSAAELKAKLSA